MGWGSGECTRPAGLPASGSVSSHPARLLVTTASPLPLRDRKYPSKNKWTGADHPEKGWQKKIAVPDLVLWAAVSLTSGPKLLCFLDVCQFLLQCFRSINPNLTASVDAVSGGGASSLHEVPSPSRLPRDLSPCGPSLTWCRQPSQELSLQP